MIYGYTHDAPWFGDHSLLFCKNVWYVEHFMILTLLRVHGGGFFIKELKEGSYVDDDSRIRPHSKHYTLQYSGPTNIIKQIVKHYEIQILAEFNRNVNKLDELDIINEMNLAAKLEQD